MPAADGTFLHREEDGLGVLAARKYQATRVYLGVVHLSPGMGEEFE